MAVNNSTIMAKAWLNGGNDYQQRVPNPTQGDISRSYAALLDPANIDLYNQFCKYLVNRIGTVFVHNQREWVNPLEPFMQSNLLFGNSEEEVAAGWVKAHSYDQVDESLLKKYLPNGAMYLHEQNRQDYYPITINRAQMKRAFTDEYGLNSIVSAIMQAPINSDNYDTYRIMMQQIAEYEHTFGFHKIKLDEPTDQETARAFLKSARAMAGRLKFPSTLYNATEDIPVFVNRDELVLLVTPEVNAALDVDALASVFNLGKAETQLRTIEVDEFPIPNVIAMLCSDYFFRCRRTEYGNYSFFDPKTLSETYFLHDWGIYSASPIAPALLWTTDTATATDTITLTMTALNIAGADTASAGDEVPLTLTANGTLAPEGAHGSIEIAPDSATFELSAASAASASDSTPITPVQLNSRTYVDRDGVLHLQRTGLAAGNVVTVKATSTYCNPSGATPAGLTATHTVTIK